MRTRKRVSHEFFLEHVNNFKGAFRKEANMSGKPHRQVFGAVLWATRAIGLILIGLAILGFPQMRYFTGGLATSFGLIMSMALGLVGVVWLFGVEVFLYFFDRYLSRN
jgi:hypothetical protein